MNKTFINKTNVNKNIISLIILLILFSTKPYANTDIPVLTLEVDPEQCVSIVQGDDCFVDVTIKWYSQQPADYCLFSSQQPEPLKCWKKNKQGDLKKEFVANENIVFYLKRPPNEEVIVEEVLEMAWVYKDNGRSRASWRMF
jgi:hypothetical protein